MFDENLKKEILNFKFSNHDINKFILLLPKFVFQYEYMMTEKNSMKHYLRKKILTVT